MLDIKELESFKELEGCEISKKRGLTVGDSISVKKYGLELALCPIDSFDVIQLGTREYINSRGVFDKVKFITEFDRSRFKINPSLDPTTIGLFGNCLEINKNVFTLFNTRKFIPILSRLAGLSSQNNFNCTVKLTRFYTDIKYDNKIYIVSFSVLPKNFHIKDSTTGNLISDPNLYEQIMSKVSLIEGASGRSLNVYKNNK